MKKIIYSLIFIGSICLTSCSDFLDIDPKNKQTTTTAFKTYDNFKTYSWGLYGDLLMAGDMANFEKDLDSHLFVNNSSANNNNWAYQKVTEATGNSNWNFEFIRRVNVMLDHIDQSLMSDKEKAHWRSVGLFFRSMRYFQLLSMYGGVPWVEHAVEEADTEVIYGARATRDETAANILRDLTYAEENINVNGDGANTINLNVVRALISRFGLFEGTWRKYHGLSDANTYLEACAKAAEKLIKDVPNVHNSYDQLFTSESLAGITGVLLYFEYSDEAGLQHQGGRQTGSSGNQYEMTRKMIDLYLCADGKPISQSPLFGGDKTPYTEFRNRDLRLFFTVVPPFRLNVSGNNDRNYKRFRVGETIKIGLETITVTEQDSINFTENIDLLTKISTPDAKSLPSFAWNNSTTNGYSPRFRANPENGGAPYTGNHGYWFWKYYATRDPQIKHSQNTTDIARFRIGEVMLNYAEAMFELGLFDQAVADMTINKLRPRANVAPMVVAEIDGAFDAKRDQTVPPVLWEIRRERHVELIGENFAFDDIRRWKKGHYLDEQMIGCWVKNAHYNNKLRIQGFADLAESANKEGYVIHRQKPLGFLEHYYLYPIPMKDLVLNPQLTQNPGYKDASAAN